VFASHFRSELAKRVSTRVAFYDVSLDAARFDPARDADAFVRFLHDRFADVKADLVIPLGPLANAFYAQRREELFPDSPVLVALAEERVMQGVRLRPRDASVPLRLDISRLFEHILQVLPQTSTIAIVIGDSFIERYWVNVLRTAIKPFEARVSFLYLNTLSLEEVKNRAAALPPKSAILSVQMYVDGSGVPGSRIGRWTRFTRSRMRRSSVCTEEFGKKGSNYYNPTTVVRKSTQGYAKALRGFVDPTLTYDDLRTLDKKLKLPPGWKYRAKVLEGDLGIRAINGVARIVQDDLEGTYNACFEEGGQKACSIKP
jgi:hypothetical protein